MENFKNLKKSLRRNASDKHYPTGSKGTPITMGLGRHIEIYNLMKEYEELENDYSITTIHAQGLIGRRMTEIENELFKYWIIKEEEMETKNT